MPNKPTGNCSAQHYRDFELEDQLLIIIRKSLDSPHLKFRRAGVIGTVAQVTYISGNGTSLEVTEDEHRKLLSQYLDQL